MEAKGVWDLSKVKDVPKNRNVIGNRWVMAERHDRRL
jgi:hypothetical protein